MVCSHVDKAIPNFKAISRKLGEIYAVLPVRNDALTLRMLHDIVHTVSCLTHVPYPSRSQYQYCHRFV